MSSATNPAEAPPFDRDKRWKVSFKDEDRHRGQIIGPLIVFDLDEYENDPEIAKRKMSGFVPFGYEPQGQYHLGWTSLSEAERCAKHYGVDLECW